MTYPTIYSRPAGPQMKSGHYDVRYRPIGEDRERLWSTGKDGAEAFHDVMKLRDNGHEARIHFVAPYRRRDIDD